MPISAAPQIHRRSEARARLLQVGIALLLAMAFWYYMEFVLAIHEEQLAHEQKITQGNLSDLYPRWLGSRELFLHRRNPYTPEVTREIQEGVFGRAIDPSRPGDPRDEARFAYPLYVSFLLAPTINFQFDHVRFWSMWLLMFVSAASVPLWLYALGMQTSWSSKTVWILLTISSYPVTAGIYVQQLTLFVGFLIACAAALIKQKHFGFAGVLLAIASIKPQLLLPLLAWLCLWVLADWTNRKALTLGFLGTMLALLVPSEVLMPGWARGFTEGMEAYQKYAGDPLILQALLGRTAGTAATVLVTSLLVTLCWKARKADADTLLFRVAQSMVLACTLLFIPKLLGYNQVLLLPALMIIFEKRGWLLANSRATRFVWLLSLVVVGWQWLAAIILDLTSVSIPEIARRLWFIPFGAILLMPVAVVAALCFVAFSIFSEPRRSRTIAA